MTQKFDERKLEELALFVAAEAVTNKFFTASDLNDVLFLLDSLAAAELGEPLTAQVYLKRPAGPEMIGVTPEQISSDLVVLEVQSEDGPFESIVALRTADLSVFSPAQRSLIKRVTSQIKDAKEDELAYYTHGWMTRYRNVPTGFPLPRDSALIFT